MADPKSPKRRGGLDTRVMLLPFGSSESGPKRPNRWEITLRLRCLLVLWSVLTLVGQGFAQGCEGWNTRGFFESATSAAVSDCLAAGADVGASDKDIGTLLHLAALFNDNPTVITALVAAGADVGARNRFDNTPLHLAAESSDSPAVITALIEAGRIWAHGRPRKAGPPCTVRPGTTPTPPSSKP